MHNALTRLQNVFGTFTSVASTVALLIALISLITTPSPNLKPGSLELKNVQVVKGRPHYYTTKKEEYAHIKFDLDVDLSTLFTWNTKQVFLYITATYPAPASSPANTPPSTAIIWDAILAHPLSPTHHNQYIYPSAKKKTSSKLRKVRQPKPPAAPQTPGLLQLSAQRPKYQITDPTGRLAGRANATLELAWNVQPWVGALTWSSPARQGSPGDAHGGAAVAVAQGWPWSTWRAAGQGARSGAFGLPALRDAVGAAGGKAGTAGAEDLKVEKGAEGHRLMG